MQMLCKGAMIGELQYWHKCGYGHKCCNYFPGHKAKRRYLKRRERQKWKKEVRNSM